MRCLTVIVALLLAVSSARGVQPSAASAPAVAPEVEAVLKRVEVRPDDDVLRQKHKEYHNTAVELLEYRIAAYRSGTADASTVFDAAKDVSDAKLSLAQSARERGDARKLNLDGPARAVNRGGKTARWRIRRPRRPRPACQGCYHC